MLDALIVGAGMSGILAAIKLKEAGFGNILIVDKAASLGGTWWDNRYPGCACDVPSHFYSYSFAPNPDWSSIFPRQEEILAYFEKIADTYALRPLMRFNTELASADFDAGTNCWNITAKGGERLQSRLLFFATGQLSRPLMPVYPGMESFTGRIFHSARWDHDHDLTGKKVAVIGTGPTAAQFVPEIVGKVDKLVVFQRTANWFFSRNDKPYSSFAKGMFRNVPGAMRLHRLMIYTALESRWPAFKQGSFMAKYLTGQLKKLLAEAVPDPALRAKLTPDYPVGCKRIIIADDFLPALQKPNVHLETSGISSVTENAIIDKDGTRHDVDTIIYGTGFEATDFLVPIRVTGTSGQELSQVWKNGAEAYQGATVAGFPNMFILYGPNTNLGHNSIIFMVENQMKHVMALVKAMRARNLKAIDVKADVMTAYNVWLQNQLTTSVWNAGCRSWYINGSGKITQNWPSSTFSWWRRMRKTNLADFQLIQ